MNRAPAESDDRLSAISNCGINDKPEFAPIREFQEDFMGLTRDRPQAIHGGKGEVVSPIICWLRKRVRLPFLQQRAGRNERIYWYA